MFDSLLQYTTPRFGAYNNNNSYTALDPVQIYKLAALYIINIKIRLKIKKYKYYKCIH